MRVERIFSVRLQNMAESPAAPDFSSVSSLPLPVTFLSFFWGKNLLKVQKELWMIKIHYTENTEEK